MDDEPAEQVPGKRQRVSLANLYLDPNNYRFADHPDYVSVTPDDVFKPDVQRRTTTFVLGRRLANVQDLVASIKENGWLELDPILVERRDRVRFLVIEGNRRVATLKHLQRRYEEDSIDLGKLNPETFSRLLVVLHETADERQHLVMMGLHHISGKRRWPAVSRAMAIKRLQKHFDGDSDRVCNTLGLTKREFNLSIRTLALVDAYKQSDFGDQFRSDQYNLFREVLVSPSIREWLGWDNDELVARNPGNLERLFQWMSSEPEPEEVEGDVAASPTNSDPVLTTVGHVRELAKIIDDPKAVKGLDETRSLQEATLSSELLVKREIDGAFASCDRGIQRLTSQVSDLTANDLDLVDRFVGRLQGLAFAHRRRPLNSSERLPWEPFNEFTESQFSDIRTLNYRGIDGLSLDNLRRVNLIVGVNNAGKTSLLEAIHLLVNQNDERALWDALRWRGRVEGEPDPIWLADQIQTRIHIVGNFDKVPNNAASLTVQRVDEPGDDIDDQTSFLTKLSIKSCYGGQTHSTDVALFSDRPHRTHFEGQHWLCRSALTSPFWANRTDALALANKEALKAGTKARVIEFIRERLDSGVTNIELADKFNRFLVSHEDFERAPDLSSFGDGLRRIFEIGLLFANARGGVLLIDEFESAIHRELLDWFTRLVQELAVEHNVQVFLTTHSKEALDAFVLNDYATHDIAGYAICRGDDGVGVRRFDGEKLVRLHNALDFDLRGVM